MSQRYQPNPLIECEVCHAVQSIDLNNLKGRALMCNQCASPLDINELREQLKATMPQNFQTPIVMHVSTDYSPELRKAAGAVGAATVVGGGLSCMGTLLITAFIIIITGTIAYLASEAEGSLSSIAGITSQFTDNAKELDPSEVRQGHGGRLEAMAYSPDGYFMASGGEDYLIRLWNLETGTVIPLYGPDRTTVDLAFSPTGEILAASDGDAVYLWSVPSGKPIEWNYQGDFFLPEALGFSPDGQWLAISDSETALWNVRTGAKGLVLDAVSMPDDILFSPDGTKIVTVNWAAPPKVWSVESGLLLQTLEGDTAATFSTSFSPDGNLLAYNGNSEAYVYNLAENRLITLKEESFFSPRYTSFGPDGNLLAIGNFFSEVTVWDVAKEKIAYKLATDISLSDVAFSPDGSSVSAAMQDGSILTWVIFPEKRPYTPTLPTPNPDTCYVTASADVQLYKQPDSDTRHRTLRGDYRAEADGQRTVSGIVWWHLVEGAWVRSDLVTEDQNCADLAAL